MNTNQENLIKDIRELLKKHNKQSLTLSDINVKLPEVLTSMLAVLEQPNFSTSHFITEERKFIVITNGNKSFCAEDQVSELRKNNSANMLLDIPKRTLTINLSGLNKIFNYEVFSFSSKKIISHGMTKPGEYLNQDLFWSSDTLKRYIFATRQLLGDSKKNIIITDRGETSPIGSYYFNPRLNLIVIKNQKSTSIPPSIYQSELE